MIPQYLLDTNILSEPLRPHPNAGVIRKLQRHQEELATASIVWHELWFGCQKLPKSAKRQSIEAYLEEVVTSALVILPYDQLAAEWHAAERARLVAAGRTPSFADGQIAAVAATTGLTLVTMNRIDYQHFDNLTIEDWRS